MSKPLISVIIPAYNREKYIDEAIESVLNQNYAPLELIVVDDGSTDRTAEIIQSYGNQLIYVYQKNQGVAQARNTGLTYANGTFYAFVDSDDIWVKNKLINQMAVFDAMPNLDIVFGHSEQFISPELDDDFKKKVKIPTKILPCQTPCAFLVKKIVFEKVGLFNPDFRVGSEMDWYARLIDLKLSTFMMPEVLFYRRIHQNNSAQSNHDANFQRLRVLKGALDRRKAAGFGAK